MRLQGRRVSWRQFLRTLWRNFVDDDILNIAGSVAFFGTLSLFPFLLFLASLASLVIDLQTANQLVEDLGKVAPREVTQILGDRIRALGARNSGGVLTASIAAAIFTASGGVVSLSGALNRAFAVKKARPMLHSYLVAILTVFAAALLGLLAMALTLATPLLVGLVGPRFGPVLLALRLPVAGLIMLFTWALVFHFLPNDHRPFQLFTPGSIVGILAWLLVSWLFTLYVDGSHRYEVTYGALGGTIIMLTWLWISVIVMLVGAEINALVQRKPGRPIPGERPL